MTIWNAELPQSCFQLLNAVQLVTARTAFSLVHDSMTFQRQVILFSWLKLASAYWRAALPVVVLPVEDFLPELACEQTWN